MELEKKIENLRFVMFMEMFVESALEQGYKPSVYNNGKMDYDNSYPTKE